MSKYIGKWVVKNEEDENPSEVLDVIEVDEPNNIVRAVGKNLTIQELTRRYVKADQLVVDPFAINVDINNDLTIVKDIVEEQIRSTEKVEEKVDEVFISETSKQQRKLTEEEELVETLISRIRKNFSSSSKSKINISIEIDFDLDELLSMTNKLAIDEETVFAIIANNLIQNRLYNSEELAQILRNDFLESQFTEGQISQN